MPQENLYIAPHGAIRRVFLRMAYTRVFLLKTGLPFVFATGMCILFYATESSQFPKDASPEEWQLFVDRVLHHIKNTDNLSVITLVMCAHIAHTVLCIPCVHLTQMFCAYCIGFVYASIVCILCEISIVTAYIMAYSAGNTFRDQYVSDIVTYLRKNNMLYVFIFASQMSSVPMNSTSCIIGADNVSVREYLFTHYVVSTINSCKCCFLGHQIRVATQKSTIAYIGYIIFIISVIPTLVTVALWYFMFVWCQHNVVSDTALHPERTDAQQICARNGASVSGVLPHVWSLNFLRSWHNYDIIKASGCDHSIQSLPDTAPPEHDEKIMLIEDMAVIVYADCAYHESSTTVCTPVASPVPSECAETPETPTHFAVDFCDALVVTDTVPDTATNTA